jgi:hypothetical protein
LNIRMHGYLIDQRGEYNSENNISAKPELEVEAEENELSTAESGIVWSHDKWEENSLSERKRFNAFDYKTHGLRINAVLHLLYSDYTTKQVGSITGQSDKMVDLYARQIEQEKLAKVAMKKYAEWSKSGK